MSHQFYEGNTHLFSLADAAEYDTATPYRYAVSRFVEVAAHLRAGRPVTVVSEGDGERVIVLQTIGELWHWLSKHFSGFEDYVR